MGLVSSTSGFAEAVTGAATVDDVVKALKRKCELSESESRGLLSQSLKSIVPLTADSAKLSNDEDEDRVRRWQLGNPTSDLVTALERLSSDPNSFLQAVLSGRDKMRAEFEAAVHLDVTKDIGREISNIWVVMFCSDGIEHLLRWGSEWASQPLTSPGWEQKTLYVPIGKHPK